MIPRVTFAERLTLARRLARHAAPASVHQADQLDAASAEARTLHDRMGAVLPIVSPDRTWHQRLDSEPSPDVRAYLLAAVLGCTTVCPHLRRGGPQPAFVRLPLQRIDCARCVGIIRRPPPDEADRCDVCERRGVTTFVPFAVRQGPALIAGDACPHCASVLGLLEGAGSPPRAGAGAG